MLQLQLLLEKLYQHKSNLEWVIFIHEMHCDGPSESLNAQYALCLNNIHRYEFLIESYKDDFP